MFWFVIDVLCVGCWCWKCPEKMGIEALLWIVVALSIGVLVVRDAIEVG